MAEGGGGGPVHRAGADRVPARAGAKPLAALLDQRFGDGTIYLVEPPDRALLEEARRAGLVSWESGITPEGYALWARWEAGLAQRSGTGPRHPPPT